MPRNAAKTGSKQTIRQQQRDWLREVMRITNRKASQLAVDGGVSDTTLTRFLNKDDYDGILSPLTISRIAEAVGIPPPGASPARGFHDEGEPYLAGPNDEHAEAVRQYLGTGVNRTGWRIRSDALQLAGVRAGDLLIVDETLTPKSGDIVVAQIEHGIGASTVFRLFQPPMLIGAAADPTLIKPEIVDGERVRIVGVMIALLRGRA
jgi:SOS-response transcriptional repressor LexA